ncbi:TPA: calcium/sodium antiporter [Candidatus Woesearchaeota archaeon]|nr:calcium/sodium antiporter [Candidatus Woesearchaeota archaeon]HIH12212.1 calcium/sodium antiporter [Candidatus Woesearchaeota archaeon]
MIELIGVIALIVMSLLFVVKGADFLVDGAVDTAKWLKVSPILIGLTIVAIGTSLPELVISLFAAIGGSPDLSFGNIIGSNSFNLAVIIGISALIFPLTITLTTLTYQVPFLVISSLLIVILGNDLYIFQRNAFTLGRFDGLILLGAFAIFSYYIFLSARKDMRANRAKNIRGQNSFWKNLAFIVGGFAGLILGAKVFTYAAVKLATIAGLSEAFIGLTIAAVGTSLPELVTSVVAVCKKQSGIAVGDIIGSNIFNVLFVLGITGLIHPLTISNSLIAIDGMVLVFISLLFLYFAARYQNISRWEGGILLTSYLIYFAFLMYRL